MQNNQSKQQLLKLAKTIVQDLKKYQQNKDWKKYGDKPCLMEKMQMGQGIATKSTSIVNFSIKEILQFLQANGTLKQLNPTCLEDKRLWECDQITVNYLRYSAPWPISHRDFISVAYKFSQCPQKVYLGTKACNYPYPLVDKIVRGQILIGGYILQSIDQKTTKVTYIASANIKGSLPKLVKNEISKKQGQVANKIEIAMKLKKQK